MKQTNFTVENCTRMYQKIRNQYKLINIKVAITDVKNTGQIEIVRGV